MKAVNSDFCPHLSGNICPFFRICPTRGTCPFHAPKPSISKVYYNHLSPFRDFVFYQTCNSQEIPLEKAPLSGLDSYIVQLSLSSLTIFQSLSKCRTKYLVRRHSTFDPSSVVRKNINSGSDMDIVSCLFVAVVYYILISKSIRYRRSYRSSQRWSPWSSSSQIFSRAFASCSMFTISFANSLMVFSTSATAKNIKAVEM